MSNLGLEGKAVLIIGASRGIGASTARVFAREGARLVLGARDLPALQDLASELPPTAQAVAIRTDLNSASDLERAVAVTLERFGRLDIACNNGGISQKRALFADTPDEAFDAAMNTNARGVFIAMKHQIRAMLAGGGGSIVNTGSIASFLGMPQMAAYAASKHALVGLSKAAALDYADRNIRVNVIAPGPVETRLTQQGALATPEGRRMVESLTPMRRVAHPDEIAETVAWLASARSSYVTGAVLPADGGYSLP